MLPLPVFVFMVLSLSLYPGFSISYLGCLFPYLGFLFPYLAYLGVLVPLFGVVFPLFGRLFGILKISYRIKHFLFIIEYLCKYKFIKFENSLFPCLCNPCLYFTELLYSKFFHSFIVCTQFHFILSSRNICLPFGFGYSSQIR